MDKLNLKAVKTDRDREKEFKKLINKYCKETYSEDQFKKKINDTLEEICEVCKEKSCEPMKIILEKISSEDGEFKGLKKKIDKNEDMALTEVEEVCNVIQLIGLIKKQKCGAIEKLEKGAIEQLKKVARDYPITEIRGCATEILCLNFNITIKRDEDGKYKL